MELFLCSLAFTKFKITTEMHDSHHATDDFRKNNQIAFKLIDYKRIMCIWKIIVSSNFDIE